MKYTLEIQKLLLQAQNKNLHPREKANLLKEAIRIADENEDVEWATEMRLDLIYELNLLSALSRAKLSNMKSLPDRLKTTSG